MKNTSINDVSISTRCRSIPLAGALLFLAEYRMVPRSLSELIRMITEDYYKLLVVHQLAEEIPTTAIARDILGSSGLERLNSSGRGLSNAHKAMQVDNIIASGGDPATAFKKKLKHPKKDDTPISKEDQQAAHATYVRGLEKEREEEDAKQNRISKDALSRAPDSLVVKTEKKGDKNED